MTIISRLPGDFWKSDRFLATAIDAMAEEVEKVAFVRVAQLGQHIRLPASREWVPLLSAVELARSAAERLRTAGSGGSPKDLLDGFQNAASAVTLLAGLLAVIEAA